MPAERPACILVVDDDESVRALLARALRVEGYEVVAVGCGPEGVYAAQAAAPYDLVVTNRFADPLKPGDQPRRLWADFPGVPVLHLDQLCQPSLGDLPGQRLSLYQPFSLETLVRRVHDLLIGRPAGR